MSATILATSFALIHNDVRDTGYPPIGTNWPTFEIFCAKTKFYIKTSAFNFHHYNSRTRSRHFFIHYFLNLHKLQLFDMQLQFHFQSTLSYEGMLVFGPMLLVVLGDFVGIL